MPKKDEQKQTEEINEVEATTEEATEVEAETQEADTLDTESENTESADQAEVTDNVELEDFAETGETAQDFDPNEPVTVQPVQFGSFEELNHTQGEVNKNLDILMDIKLQLTVELGRTELPIRKVLELTRGSIIELEKIAGEPVELYANGKLVAHGEVVVIEDNFGLRITSITDPEDRIKGL